MPSKPSGTHAAFRSKPVAGALALLLGALGAHRLYLGSRWWWIYPVLALPALGLALGSEEWFRHPAIVVPTLVKLVAFGEAIRFSLTPDERWDAARNPGSSRRSHNRWAPVLIAIASLILGAIVMMSVMALMMEAYFAARRAAR